MRGASISSYAGGVKPLPGTMDRRCIQVSLITIAIAALLLASGCSGTNPLPPGGGDTPTPPGTPGGVVMLPDPALEGNVSVEEALQERRSARIYAKIPLTLAEIGQILWAAQGVTDDRGYRTAPSAGALYPLEVYIVAGDVIDLAPGVYHYQPEKHLLIPISSGDRRADLQAAAINQTPVGGAPATVVITAIPDRTTAKYSERGLRYVDMEAGHASENIYLQVAAIRLGTVTIGAFDDDGVREILGLPEDEVPLYLMPVGWPIPRDM